MRLVFSLLALFVGLCQCSFATDYELTVERSAQGLLDANRITVVEPYGLIHAGDRIVSLRVGTLPDPCIPCKVVAGSTPDGAALSNVRIKDFNGQFEVATKAPGAVTTYSAGLLMHTGNVPMKGAASAAVVSSVWSEGPWIWIALGAVGLFLVIVSLIRLSKSTGGGLPLYGKKVYEDNLRDVKARLERIAEAQELLVAKPPVLRTFRKQIGRFEQQLDKLQITAVTTQQALAVLASSTVELQSVVQAIASHQKEDSSSTSDLHRLVERSWTEQRDLSLTTKADLDKLSKNIAELSKAIADTQAQLSKEWQNEQTHRHATEQARLEAQSAESARMKKIADSLLQLHSGLEGLKQSGSISLRPAAEKPVKRSEPDAAPLASVEENSASVLPPSEPAEDFEEVQQTETPRPEGVFPVVPAEIISQIEEIAAELPEEDPVPEDHAETSFAEEPVESAFAEAADEPVIVHLSALENAVEETDDTSEWRCAGADGSGKWSSAVDDELQLVHAEGAIQAVCPAETPGIEHGVGALLYRRGKVIYAHGDHVRAFWPGKNPKAVALSKAIPADSWRLLVVKDHLFCVAESSVEVLDLNNWTRTSSFSGRYLAQCATGDLWCGLKADSPELEYRDAAGVALSSPVPLPEGYGPEVELLSDGNIAYTVTKTGRVCRVDTARALEIGSFELTDQFAVEHALLNEAGVVALVSGPAGISVRHMAWNGNHRIVANSDVKFLSGNVTAIDHLVYFFDAERSELVVCDTRKGLLLDAISLPSVEILRRMIGLKAGNGKFLLIAGSDGKGVHGSVFLLEPKTEKHVLLCSTNQPHVDIILAGEKPVVATSNSFQNIIRIFEPFEAAARSDKAA